MTGLAFAWFFSLERGAPELALGFALALLPSTLHTWRWRNRALTAPAVPPSHRDAMRGAWLASGGACLFLLGLAVKAGLKPR
jgi:hypothetical protein